MVGGGGRSWLRLEKLKNSASLSFLPPGPPVGPPPPPFAHDYAAHVPRNFNVAKALLPEYKLGFAAQDGCVTCVTRMLAEDYDPMGESNSGWVAMDWAGYGKKTLHKDTDEVMGILALAGGTFSGRDPKSCQPDSAE